MRITPIAVMVATLLTACQAPREPAAAIEHAVALAFAEVVTVSGARCEQYSRTRFACAETFRSGPRHYSTIGIDIRPARSRRPARAIWSESGTFGPGGGFFSYVGQTSDHRYDIVVGHGDLLGPDDHPRLPEPDAVIRRIKTLYDRARR